MAAIDQRKDESQSPSVKPETPPAPEGDSEEGPTLSISREKVCYIVFKVREFDVKDLPTVEDEGSNPADEKEMPVLEDRPDDPVRQELAAFISALNFDERVDLVTMTWIGRGDGTLANWDELRDIACDEHSRWTARYLLSIPLLGDYLSEALAQFGYSCEEIADEHLTV